MKGPLLLFIAISAQLPGGLMAQQACGPKDTHFKVDLDDTRHDLAKPESGKALVYFVQDMDKQNGLGVTTQVGIDGNWVGANRDNSWFAVSVAPGEHHICVTGKSHIYGEVLELAHFTAEAGQTYYFRSRNFRWHAWRLDFGPADSDQATYMIRSYTLSISHGAAAK